MYKLIILLITIGFCSSCSKEYSFENPILKGTVINIGNDCVINKVIDYDTIVRRNVASLKSTFNVTGGYPTSIVEFDSLTLQSVFQKSIILIGDTLRIDANQYFLIDANNNYRVRKFIGRQNPYNNNSPIFVHTFFYNNAGQLSTKIVNNGSQAGVVYSETNYTYTNDNLTSIKSKIPINNVTYFDATIQYDSSKFTKNYLLLLPEAIELKPYIAAVNFGVKSKNQPKKITITNNDQITGTALNTTNTEFINYKYSTDGYVLSVDMGGFAIPAIPLSSSRNLFQYFCR